MAESWRVDGNDYYFTLHEDAKFHDGEPLTADDVVFTVDYYRGFLRSAIRWEPGMIF